MLLAIFSLGAVIWYFTNPQPREIEDEGGELLFVAGAALVMFIIGGFSFYWSGLEYVGPLLKERNWFQIIGGALLGGFCFFTGLYILLADIRELFNNQKKPGTT